jgi:hypothetical protein
MLDASLAGGTVTGSASLGETARSLNTKLRLVADNVSLDTLRGYIGRPPGFLEGTVEHLAISSEGTSIPREPGMPPSKRKSVIYVRNNSFSIVLLRSSGRVMALRSWNRSKQQPAQTQFN